MRRASKAPEHVRKRRAHYEKRREIPFTSWSFTAWETYSACPLQYKFRYIQRAKMPPPTGALKRGNDIHKGAEDYLCHKTLGVPLELGTKWSAKLSELRQVDAVAEEPWAFTSTFGVTQWSDDDAWLRMKLDARVDDDGRIEIIDFKTGNIYSDKHAQQVDLYALGAFCRYPEVEQVDVGMWYFDKNRIVKYEYSASELDTMKARWTKRALMMAKDRHHLPRQGRHCKWCSFNVRNGGECKHGARWS